MEENLTRDLSNTGNTSTADQPLKVKMPDGSELLLTDNGEQEQQITNNELKNEISFCYKILHFIDKYFILIGLAIVIPLSSLWPIGHNKGPLKPKITSSWVVVILLFFIIGLGTKLENLKKSMLYWQLNLFTQIIIFVCFPAFGYAMYNILNYLNPRMEPLLSGYLILSCLPATAVSAAVLAANAAGNDIAAAVNCTISNLIGIFITPYLILLLTGDTGTIDELELFSSLILRIIVPLIVAQILRFIGGKPFNNWILKNKKLLKKINEIALLYMVFCALSESFYSGMDTHFVDVIIVILLVVGTHCFFCVVVWYLSGIFRCTLPQNSNKSIFLAFSTYDRIGIIFTATSKTIAFGVPLIETMYADDDNVGLFMIGILLYKPTQLIVGSLLVEPLYKLIQKENQKQQINSKSEIKASKSNYAALTAYDLGHKTNWDLDIAD